jgi:hypothetical protein
MKIEVLVLNASSSHKKRLFTARDNLIADFGSILVKADKSYRCRKMMLTVLVRQSIPLFGRQSRAGL